MSTLPGGKLDLRITTNGMEPRFLASCGYLTGAADHTEILSVGEEQTEVPTATSSMWSSTGTTLRCTPRPPSNSSTSSIPRRHPPSCWRSAQSANRKPFPDRNFCPAMRPSAHVCSRGCGHPHMDRKYATFCVPMARECGSGGSVARGALAAPPRGATTPLLVIAESWPAGNCRPGAPKRRLGTGRVGNLRDWATRVYVALRR